MNKNGPIIIIEDDQYLLEQVFHRLHYNNERIFFSDGQTALDYLTTTTELPFLILSDINMPRLDGFALREKLHTDAGLHIKCIPYLFFSTGVS
jgi:DNA-binding response OmpR family regulator